MQRNSVFYFGALAVLAVAGFWPTYFFPRRYEGAWHVHLHGVVMFLWLALTVAQAGLARAGRLRTHRALGRASYVLVPLIVASTLLVAHFRLRQQVNDELLYFFAVQLGLLVVLVVAYAGAMVHRRAPALHARYMACVALTLLDPIVARILAVRLAMEPPLLQVVTFGLTDAILAILMWADWRRYRRLRVYPGMLAVFVLMQLPTFLLPATPAWRAFAEAFARLPLP